MQVAISKEVTGVGKETYTGEFKITARVDVNFKTTTENGHDLRDTDPETAKHMVEDTKRRITHTIADEMTRVVVEEMEKAASTKKQDFYVTPHITKRLLLVNPNELAKVVKEKERKEVKKIGVSVRDEKKRTPRPPERARAPKTSTTTKKPDVGQERKEA